MKNLGMTGLLCFAGLILASLILVAHITQTSGIQIIFIQSLYWSLDHSWGLARAIINFIVAMAASSIILINIGRSEARRNLFRSRLILPFIAVGMLLSLGCHYLYQCCDTPVTLHMGFPLSWLYSPVYGILQSVSRADFLLQYVTDGKWFVNWWGLITDLLFWFNTATLLWLFHPIGLALKSGRLGNFPDPNASVKP